MDLVSTKAFSVLADRHHVDVSLRFIPGHHWVRLFASFTGDCEPGHAWMYANCMRRDAWRIGRLGFGIMRLPRSDRGA